MKHKIQFNGKVSNDTHRIKSSSVCGISRGVQGKYPRIVEMSGDPLLILWPPGNQPEPARNAGKCFSPEVEGHQGESHGWIGRMGRLCA